MLEHMVVRYQIHFDSSPPTIEAIAQRFRELSGLQLAIEKFGPDAYSITSSPLRSDVELLIGQVIEMIVFRVRFGYFEWTLVRTLQNLGGRIPLGLVPRYASVPWASLPWHQKWLHR
jgi:hypothetical protein